MSKFKKMTREQKIEFFKKVVEGKYLVRFEGTIRKYILWASKEDNLNITIEDLELTDDELKKINRPCMSRIDIYELNRM